MTGTPSYAVTFARKDGETPTAMGDRLRALAADLAARKPASSVVLLVADEHPDIPAESMVDAMQPTSFAAVLLTAGAPVGEIAGAEAIYRVRSNVIQASFRGDGGQRTPGVTLALAINRTSALSKDEFVAYWADRHAPVHLRCSPATAWYEQLVVDEVMTRGATPWDGIGLVGYASDDLVNNMFANDDAQAELFADIGSFLDESRVRALVVSEYVYRT